MFTKKLTLVMFSYCFILAGCGGSDNSDSLNANQNLAEKNNVDVTPPVININGDNPLNLQYGLEYEDQGATASDKVDGTLVVTVSSNVNSNVVGKYSVEYSAQDSSGNSIKAVRTVNVVNKTETLLSSVIEDQNLLSCILESGYKNISEVKVVNCPGRNITSAKGISSLENLVTLNLSFFMADTSYVIYSNNISDIDVSKNLHLEELDLSKNKLSEIDVRNNIKLRKIDLNDNQIKSIDVSENVNLEFLSLQQNQISDIDISNNIKLNFFNTWENQLSDVDLSNNKDLKSLILSSNNLSDVDLKNNLMLEMLVLGTNTLSTVDVSNNDKLTILDISNNNLSDINVKNNTLVNLLYLDENNFTSIDLNNNPDIEVLALDEEVVCFGDICAKRYK